MAVEISHLNKHIGKQHVLRDVCLSIGDGEVVGLLGPNGAGKSTLMKIMVGVWDADSSPVTNCHLPKTIGYLPELNPLYEEMYVREYLRFFVELRSNNQSPIANNQLIESLITRVGLTAEANKRVGQLSKGYKQRVGLAQAMIGDPELLILDEPCHGLDDENRSLILDLLETIASTGTTTLLHVTHEQDEVLSCEKNIIELLPGQKPMYRLTKISQ